MGRMTLYIGAAIVIVAVVACAAMVLLDNDDDGARVVYDPNISLEEPFTVGSNVVAGCDLVRDGYVFAGWNTSEDGTGVTYLPGEVLGFESGTMQLWAMWYPVISSIMWNAPHHADFEERIMLVHDDGSEVKVNGMTPVLGIAPTHATIAVTDDHYTWTITVDDEGKEVFRGIGPSGDVCWMSLSFIGSVKDVEPGLDEGGRPTYDMDVGGEFGIVVLLDLE